MAEKRLAWILVVNDDAGSGDAIGRILRDAGFEISEASSVRQTIELAKTKPDAIVLDGDLRDATGVDVTRDLRADPVTAVIPIIQLSPSDKHGEDQVRGLENGANAYFIHPIEPAVFLATVRSLVRMRLLEDERESAASEWRATFDAISDLVCVVDATGAVRRANRAAVLALSKDGGTVLDKQWLSAMADAFPNLDTRPIGDALARRRVAAIEQQTGDRWLRVAIDPMSSGSNHEGSAVCVVTDITPRKMIEKERTLLLAAAETARTQAEKANSAKSEFLATMSHELRTPINAILGYAQILDMGIAGSVSVEQRQQLDRMRRSALHLITLVNELLDLGTVESGDMRIDAREAFVDEVVEDALAIARPQANARGISIAAAESEPRRLSFIGDVGRVRQILVNLLSNAIKFSDAGSRITLRSEVGKPPESEVLVPGRRYVAVQILDTGIGVSPAQFSAIFEPFVQGETGPTRSWGGSGVGLAISRRLARLMQGDVTVTAPRSGGSHFTLWLPCPEDPSIAATAEQPVARRRSTPFDPTILSQLGRLLAMDAFNIGNALVLRIRTDDRFPPAGSLSDAQLIDHFPSFATDLGLALVTIAEVGIDASAQLHDGNAIRSEVAARHGAQRCRLGWTEAQLLAEYDLIREEVEADLKGRAASGQQQLEGALDLIGRMIDQSRAVSLQAYRERWDG